MNKYYKGKLFIYNEVKSVKYNVDGLNKVLETSNNKFYNWYNSLDIKRREILDNYFSKGLGSRKELLNILKEFNDKVEFEIPYIKEIIYEAFQNEDGVFFGRELITNIIFPIIKNNTLFIPSYVYKKIFYENSANNLILTTSDDSREYYMNGIYYEDNLIDKDNNLYNVILENNKIYAIRENIKFEIKRKSGRTQDLNFRYNYEHNKFYDNNVFIENDDIVTVGELGNYYRLYKNSRERNKFVKLMKNLDSQNLYLKKLNPSFCDDDLLSLYSNNSSIVDYKNYVKLMSKKSLDNLRNSNYPITYLTINDIDKIIENIEDIDEETNYYISILYTLVLLEISYNNIDYSLNNSYINKYLYYIVPVLKKLKRENLISIDISIFDKYDITSIIELLKGDKEKIKKLV